MNQEIEIRQVKSSGMWNAFIVIGNHGYCGVGTTKEKALAALFKWVS